MNKSAKNLVDVCVCGDMRYQHNEEGCKAPSYVTGGVHNCPDCQCRSSCGCKKFKKAPGNNT